MKQIWDEINPIYKSGKQNPHLKKQTRETFVKNSRTQYIISVPLEANNALSEYIAGVKAHSEISSQPHYNKIHSYIWCVYI